MTAADTTSENPRTRRVRELMLTTAVELLLEAGAHEVTAARIAERADVARTTVYRQWPDQRTLLLATIEQLTTPHAPGVTAGPVENDVRVALEQLRSRLVNRDVRSVFGALAGHACQDEGFRDAQRLFVTQLTQPVVSALNAGIARGDLDAATDCTFEANLLAGPILHCHLALHDEIPDALLDTVIARWQHARTPK